MDGQCEKGPKRMDSMREGLREKGLVGDEFEEREEWRSLVENADPV